MHSAIITVNVGSGIDTVFGFVVSKSSTAPDHGTIKDKPIFYTRKFTSEQSRNLYLSVTDKTPTTVAGFTKAGTPAKLTDSTQYLAEGTKYYLYTYNSSGTVVNTYSFTTQDYPTAAVVDAATVTAEGGALYGYENFPSPTPVVDMKKEEAMMLSMAGIKLITGYIIQKRASEASAPLHIQTTCNTSNICFLRTKLDPINLNNAPIDSSTRSFSDLLLFLREDPRTGDMVNGTYQYSDGPDTPQEIIKFKEVTE